jgi:branched-chain amino acid aminotransferase
MTGNMSKITPVTAFDGVSYEAGPVTARIRQLYWDWAATQG